MPYTKPVITEPYYDCPVWIDNEVERKAFICLTANSTNQDVELFLLLLFGFNGIDAAKPMKASFDEILLEQEVAMSGGVAFLRTISNTLCRVAVAGWNSWTWMSVTAGKSLIIAAKGHPCPSLVFSGFSQKLNPSGAPRVVDRPILFVSLPRCQSPFAYEAGGGSHLIYANILQGYEAMRLMCF